MLILIGASISLFLALLLLGKRGKTGADIVLAVWFLVMALHLSLIWSYISGFSYEHPSLLGLDLPLPLVYGPLMLLYVRLLLGHSVRKNLLVPAGFIVPAGFYIYQLHFFLLSGDEKIAFYRLQEAEPGLYISVLYIAVLASGFLYSSISALQLRAHSLSICMEFSYTEKINFSWLRYLVSLFSGLWICIFLTDYLPASWLLKYRLSIETLTYCLVAVFIITTGYFGLRQTNIFTSTAEVKENNQRVMKRYSRSGLGDEEAGQILDKLYALMEQEKAYINPSLTLSELAGSLGVNPNNLSQAINEKAGSSFYDLINRYRVDEFRSRVAEVVERKETILSLAFECGFNSKSTFNHIFKKQTGKPPGQYIRETKL